MSEEETKGAEETAADSTQESEESKRAESSKKEEEAIDYKKQLEETEKELKQAQFKLKQANIEKKNESKKESSTEENGDEEETRHEEGQEIDSVVEQKLEKFKLEIRKDDIGSELSKLSEDEDEQKLIKLLYENKIIKSGYDRDSIAKDLRAAQLLANAPRIERVLKEKKAFDDSKRGTSGGGGGSQKIASDSGSTKEYSADDLRLMKLYNIKPEDVKE